MTRRRNVFGSRRSLAATVALAMMAATVVITTGPAAADTPGPPIACVDDTQFNLEIPLEPGPEELQEIRGWINADAHVDEELDFSGVDTETVTFVVDFTGVDPVVTQAALESHGDPLDRWEPPLVVDVPGAEFIHSDIGHGADRFEAGDTLDQVHLEVDVINEGNTETLLSSFGFIEIEHCFGSLDADLEALLGTNGYRFDSTSDGAFAFVGETSVFNPAIRNNGPDDEGDARFNWALDLVGATKNTDDGSHAVIDEDFTWDTVLPCQPVHTGTIGFTPTISCRTGAVAAGATEAEHVEVSWINSGHYETAMRVISRDHVTTSPDPDPTNNEAARSFHVLEPAGDFDDDGIANAIDGTATAWDTLTSSTSFDDTRWGGTTSGEVVSGDVTISDDPADGVTVSVGSGMDATVEACGTTVDFAAGTEATLTCGSITIAVSSGSATVILDDGSTLELDDGDEATVDDDEVTVGSGSVEVTPSGGGDPITVSEGETFSTSDTDTDGDGVMDSADVCSGTTLDSIAEDDLKHHRYAWHGGEEFSSGSEDAPVFTIHDTGGCSGEQIIDELGLGRGHERFGVSHSTMETWVGE